MTTYFVSRHQGAIDWVKAQKIAFDVLKAHLQIEEINAGDTVIGTLPIQLVAQLCAKKARYFHLVINQEESMRGRPLSQEDLQKVDATLEQFNVTKIQ